MTTQQNEENVIVAYKGFDQNLKCRGFQYEVGQTYEHTGRVKACAYGFHACENPLDVWGYYPVNESRFCKVTLSGTLDREGRDSKVAAGRITIDAEIGLPAIIAGGVKYMLGLVNDVIGLAASLPALNPKDLSDNAVAGSRIGTSGYGTRIDQQGENAVIACAGLDTVFKAGPGASVAIAYWNTAEERVRLAVGYVGENIDAGVRYSVDGTGAFVQVSE